MKKVAGVAGLIGALVLLAGSAGSANKKASLEGVGFADTHITFTEPGVAEAAADRDVQAGAGTIAMSFPVTADVGRITDDDLSHVCVAAGLASTKHFDLLARVEIRKPDGYFGFVPRTEDELATFEAALEDMVMRVIGPNGCASKLRSLYIAPSNELNNELFDEGQYPTSRNWQAPIDAIRLNSYVYPRLHALADALGKTIRIVGGELDQNFAERFLKRTAAFIRSHHFDQPQMDVFGQHLYVQKGRAKKQFVPFRNIQRIMSRVRAAYGPKMPVWYTEVGAISTIPADESDGYTPLPHSLVPMSVDAQGRFYVNFLRSAACLGVARVLLWHMVDDGTEMRTGLLYLSGRPKTSYSRVVPVLQQVTDQQLVCSATRAGRVP
jgi:hypothetical protein